MKKTDNLKANKLYKTTYYLAFFTIVYNLLEGILSTYLGFEDESLALFGFGADSFIEVISGLGILHMVLRIKENPTSNRDKFERVALTITGFSFYALTFVLIFTSFYNFWTEKKPESTFWGIIISVISILIMWLLIVKKIEVGKKLNSEAILADAECTKICIYMSIILLISSGIYELTHFPYVDSIGTIAISILAFKEGRECFEKAKSNKHCSCNHD